MNSKKVMQAIGNISDRHIRECFTPPVSEQVRYRNGISFSPALAACFSAIMCVAIVLAVYILPKNLGIDKPHIDDQPTTSDVSESTLIARQYIRFDCINNLSWYATLRPYLRNDNYETDLLVCWGAYCLDMNVYPGVPMQFISPGNDISIETINGELLVEVQDHDGNWGYWEKVSHIYASEYKNDEFYFLSPILDENFQPQTILMHITVSRDGNIIGAAELQCTCRDKGQFEVAMSKTIEFPPENGEYKTVTQEELDAFFNKN